MPRELDERRINKIQERVSEIPDFENASRGLNGVKAPFSYRQEGDIRDRLIGAGVLPQHQITLKR